MKYETYETIKSALHSFGILKVRASSVFEQEEQPLTEVVNAMNANIMIHHSHTVLLEALEYMVDMNGDGEPIAVHVLEAIAKAKELTQDD